MGAELVLAEVTWAVSSSNAITTEILAFFSKRIPKIKKPRESGEASAALSLAKSAGINRSGRCSDFQPRSLALALITVAGPWPIFTAFPLPVPDQLCVECKLRAVEVSTNENRCSPRNSCHG